MHQRAQRTPIDDQPGHERTELRRRFEHGHRVRCGYPKRSRCEVRGLCVRVSILGVRVSILGLLSNVADRWLR